MESCRERSSPPCKVELASTRRHCHSLYSGIRSGHAKRDGCHSDRTEVPEQIELSNAGKIARNGYLERSEQVAQGKPGISQRAFAGRALLGQLGDA